MISMADIAAEAKVSRTTVSLVLNDRHIKGVNISEETRRLVKEVARLRGYRQNALASSMAKGKSPLIGCLGLDPGEETALYVGQIMTAAVKAAAEQNYSLKLLSSEHTVDQLVEECFGYRMSGVIIRSRNRGVFDQLREQLAGYHIPIVLIDTDYDEPGLTSINSDDADGMRQMVSHLVGLGHRKLALLAFEDFTPFSVVRKRGYLEALRSQGLSLGEESCYTTNTLELRHPFQRAEELATQILSLPDRPTAIVCNCDEVAMLVLRAAWRLNIKVPDELSVVGFGNLPMGIFSCPALTSIDRPYDQVGAAAIRQLIKPQGNDNPIKLPVKLILRQSTAQCPKQTIK